MSKQEQEQQDELGFTLSDYCNMQRRKDRAGIVGDSLIGDYDLTAEQIKLINSNDRNLRKIAVDCFFFINLRLLRKMACVFLQHNERLITVVNYEDLMQQLYVDLCAGYVKLETNQKQIRNAIYDCFKLAAVGGLEVLKDVAC